MACDTFYGIAIAFFGLIAGNAGLAGQSGYFEGSAACARKFAYLFEPPKCQIYTRSWNIGRQLCYTVSLEFNMFVWDAAIFSLEATQISSTAWGKYVSAFWAEQDDRVARAEARLNLGGGDWKDGGCIFFAPQEVYLCLDAVHIPDKPDYYHTSSILGQRHRTMRESH